MAREKSTTTTETNANPWQYTATVFDEDAILDSTSVFRPKYKPEDIQIAFALHPERDSGMEYSRLFNQGFRPVLASQVTLDYDEGVRDRKLVLRHYRRTADNMVMPTPEHVLMWRPVHVAEEANQKRLENVKKMYSRISGVPNSLIQSSDTDELIEQPLENQQSG